MRVALVYDRVNKIGGAEQVLQAFHHLFPGADWYTSLWDPRRAVFSQGWPMHTSWLNRLPFWRHHHEWLPWLMPFVFESFDFSPYDLVISVGSAEAKGIITRPGTYHLHYCLTPTRYLYSHASEYLSNPLYRLVAHYLRLWDQVASTRPDQMIAISTLVKNRIKQYYHRDSEVIFPPVDTAKFAPQPTTNDRPFAFDYFLVVSRLVPYKRIQVLVSAFNRLPDKHLVIVGTGSEEGRLKALAKSNTHFTGHISDLELVPCYQHCLAFLQANEEDFGIAMCEALSAGRPVIAYGHGGVTDIIKHGITGILVKPGTVNGFVRAIKGFDQTKFRSLDCRANARLFSLDRWQTAIKNKLNQI